MSNHNRLDLVGQRFGSLKVESFAGLDSKQHSLWACVCDCGKCVRPRGSALVNGSCKSCGCGRAEAMSQANRIDLTGQRFGMLIVRERLARTKWGNVVWLCDCACGDTVEVSSRYLVGGSKKSCGCLRRGGTNV